jgi:hypothetical protein
MEDVEAFTDTNNSLAHFDYCNIIFLQSPKMTSPIHQKVESHGCNATRMTSQPNRNREVD